MFVALRAVPGPAAEPGLASRLTTAFILAHRTGRDTLLRVPLLPPVRRVDPTFPGLGPAVLIVLAILGLQIACIVPVAIWAAFREGVTGIPALVMNPWVLGAANLVAIGSVVLYSLRHTGETPRQFFALRPIGVRLVFPVVLASVGLGIVLDQIDNLIVHVVRSRFAHVPLDLTALMRFPIGAVVTLVVVAPLTEEYAVRGLILRGLLRRHAPAVAILISALIFGVMHANLRQFVVGLVTGGVFGWWYFRTGSVAPSLLGHAVFNGVATVALLWPDAVPYLGHLNPQGEVVFQPWWITLGGLLALGGGLLWFHASAGAPPPLPPQAEPPLVASEAEPPLIAPVSPPPPAPERPAPSAPDPAAMP